MKIEWVKEKNDKFSHRCEAGYINGKKVCVIMQDRDRRSFFYYIPLNKKGEGIAEQILFSMEDAKNYAENEL